MKKCLFLPFIALALFTMFICVGCGAKETPPVTTTATAEAPPVQETQEMHEQNESAEETAEHKSEEEHESAEETAEHEAAEKQESREAEVRDEDANREPAEETAEHESEEAHESEEEHEPSGETAEHESEEAHESTEETAEHESEEAHESTEETAEHEAAEETPHETESEMVEIPSGSVLHLIPEQAMGIIYCPSLLELDYRINTLATDLMPTAENPEILAQILASSFGAGFENLAELEEIGLDLNQDFAVFMASLRPPDLSAIVHLTDPEAMKQVIAAESEGSAPTEYNGETYWSATGGSGHFAILENTLVFSQSAEVCESAIDAYKGTKQSVVSNPDYSSFLANIMKGEAQLALHFDLKSIAPVLIASLNEESESMRDNLESDPAAMAIAPFIVSMFDSVIDTLEQLESLSATLEVKGTDIQLAPSLAFKNGSEIQQSLKKMMPDELTVHEDLPDLAFVNGAFQGNQQLMLEMGLLWIKMLSTDPSEEQQAKLDALTQQMTAFYESLGKEWGFTVNFSDSFMPNYLIIYEVQDKQTAEAYMEDMFLEQFHTTMQVMKGVMGDRPELDIYDGAHAGPSLMHNGVEIKSYIFPNFGSIFGELPPEAATLMPEEWNWHYAFHEDQLFLVMGSAELIKAALDRKSGIGENFAGNPSYQKLAETFGTDSNLLLALSPITLVKSLIPIISKADPNAAAAMQMFTGMFMNMPESYSIGFSAKVQERGIDTKLLLTLGDFKQAIQMIVMMQSMGQMQ